jgi:hypothetical protein
VQRFQGSDSPKLTGERRRVSRNGGNGPRWRRDGKELFFLSTDRQIMAVTVNQGTEIELASPVALFRLPTSYRSLAPGNRRKAPTGKGSSRLSGKQSALRCRWSSTGKQG